MAIYIAWKDHYSVNDPSLDAEHKQIIACLNELHEAMQGAADGSTTKRVLDRLVQYTRTHFDHEERFMRKVDFPGFEAHKVLHDNMRQRTLGLRAHLTLVTARDVLVFLKDWWLEHIQGEDQTYAAYVAALAAK